MATLRFLLKSEAAAELEGITFVERTAAQLLEPVRLCESPGVRAWRRRRYGYE